MRWRNTLCVLSWAVVCGAASGQTFVQYFVDGVNLTDAGRGTDNMAAGDIIRFSLRANHDALSYAGGRVDFTFWTSNGTVPQDVSVVEDEFGFPFDPWEVGRSPTLRVQESDRPVGAVQPGLRDIVVQESDGSLYPDGQLVISDEIFGNGVTDYIDLNSLAPGLGGLSGAFPIASGDQVFVFDWVSDGSLRGTLRARTSDTALLYGNLSDVDPIVVDAQGERFEWYPAPGTLSVLLGGLFWTRQRHPDR